MSAGVLGDQARIDSAPLAAIAAIPLDYAGYGIVVLFVLAWLVALAVWRFGRIEQKWSAGLGTVNDSGSATAGY
jgi:high-affinity nickel-transport protein